MAQYPGITPQFEAAVDQLLDWVRTQIASVQSSTPPIPQQSNPWFSHGARGFLKKLWQGDMPEHAGRRPTLREYIAIQEEMKKNLDELLGEATHPGVERVLQEFKQRFLSIMSRYIVGESAPQQRSGGAMDLVKNFFGDIWYGASGDNPRNRPQGQGQADEDTLAREIYQQLPAAVQILKRETGINSAEEIKQLSPSAIAQMFQNAQDTPPHIKTASSDQYQHLWDDLKDYLYLMAQKQGI